MPIIEDIDSDNIDQQTYKPQMGRVKTVRNGREWYYNVENENVR
jgi:hypothetical protein